MPQQFETVVDRTAAQLHNLGIVTLKNERMSRHTSFKIGGPAALFCIPASLQQLSVALNVAAEQHLPRFILGRGTNLLFPDEGYPGLVVNITRALGAVKFTGESVAAGAGADLSLLCEAAQRAGLTGLEFAYGIPGSVGGAVFMNAGAYNGEVSQILQSVDCLDENVRQRTLQNGELGLGYRQSVFHDNRGCILSAAFKLKKGNPKAIRQTMDEHMALRRSKQPLELPSAGSIFKRPNGAFAGQLIEQCGLRGFRVGNAAISEKHCGFIVNLGGASCANVLNLADAVAKKVLEQTGHTLEKEIRVVSAAGVEDRL